MVLYCMCVKTQVVEKSSLFSLYDLHQRLQESLYKLISKISNVKL